MNRIQAFLKSLLDDGKGGYDEAIVAGLLFILVYTLTGAYQALSAPGFSFQDWGIGFGAAAGGLGGWLALRGPAPPQR